MDVSYDEQAGCWTMTLECRECGGYRHDLPLADRARREAALLAAEVAHYRHRDEGCLACQARDWRESVRVRPGHSLLWWDAQTRGWLVWMAVSGIPEGVTLPVDVRYSTSAEEAEMAARVLMGNNPLPLRIVEEGRTAPTDLPTLSRDEADHHYKLWLPCFECGGTMIALASDGGLLDAVSETLRCFAWVASDGCPLCHAREARQEDFDDDLMNVWYDPGMNDWVICLPEWMTGHPDEVGDNVAELDVDCGYVGLLGLGRYAASGEEVQAAAEACIARLRAGAHQRSD